MKKRSLKEKIWLVLDIFFVLILCYAILLTTMGVSFLIPTGAVFSESGEYIINPPLLILVIVCVVAFLVLVLRQGSKTLRRMMSDRFAADSESKDEEGSKDL
jgi:Ca2+/H+ antiporter